LLGHGRGGILKPPLLIYAKAAVILLFPRNIEAFDAHAWAADGRSLKEQIAAHGGNVLKEPEEVARNGELLHGAHGFSVRAAVVISASSAAACF